MKKGFIKSIPILCSYLFLGTAYGIMMQEAGLNWKYAMLASMFLYTGAFQYTLVTFLSTGASILTVALTALLMNSRQLFYAISYVDDFKKMGKRKLLSIHYLTDESYAVGNTLERSDDPVKEKERRNTMFYVEIFSHCYWVLASVIGSLVGQLIPFDLTGVDFCMTALFVIIFIDQWEKSAAQAKQTKQTFKAYFPAITGLVTATICLVIFGANSFMLPSLMITSALLLVVNQREQEEKMV